MKTIFKSIILLTAIFNLQSVFAQAPKKMSYQVVVRNASNALIVNASVGIGIEILQGSAVGGFVYREKHSVITNGNGLATLEIGTGVIVSGDFNTIDWSAGPYFVKTNIDPTGGAIYSISSTSELLSVPYAFYAEKSSNTNTGIHVVKATNQNITSGVDTKIDFATEITDDANAFDTATDEWKILSNGFYHIYATMRFASFPLNQFVEIVVYVNGSASKFNKYNISNDANFTISADLKLNTNDKISIHVFQSTGASQVLASAPITSYFTGYKIY
jgi:C1q domain